MPILIPPAGPAATGLLKYEWVDPQGIVRDLSHVTSPSLFVPKGSTGLGLPPVEIVSDKLPFTAGSIVRHAQTQGREITLPLYVQGASIGGLLDTFDDLYAWFATADESSRTPGYLRITRPNDDAVRQIACYYRGGLEGDMSTGNPRAALVALDLYAPDPYWTDTADETASYAEADIGDNLGVINDGDVDAYPIWTLYGPFTNPVLTNTTTGRTLAINDNPGLTISDGDTLTIDTRPSSQRTALPIINQDGISFYNRVAVNSSLWWLRSGANTFTIAASGTSGATSFDLAWLPRYRGVLR